MSVIPALGKLRQEDHHKIKVIWTTQQDTVSKKKYLKSVTRSTMNKIKLIFTLTSLSVTSHSPDVRHTPAT